MTLCVKTGYQCNCQPDEGVWCPSYKPDAYVQSLMNAIVELRAERDAAERSCDACLEEIDRLRAERNARS